MLSPKEAERELSIGAQLNLGLWIKHSMSVSLIAQKNKRFSCHAL